MSDKDRQCERLNIDIQNKRLQLDSLQNKLQRVLDQINPTTADLEQAQREIYIARGEQARDSASAYMDRIPFRGVVKGTITAIGKQRQVTLAKEEYNRIRTKYDSLLRDQNYYENEVNRQFRELQLLEDQYRNMKC